MKTLTKRQKFLIIAESEHTYGIPYVVSSPNSSDWYQTYSAAEKAVKRFKKDNPYATLSIVARIIV